ncbi:alpha-hydroxy-acid oxidizing protein [Cuniculiplasma divulgatum]|uniref:L-lactate 2-monooxygenase n=1 Tax=Cuniculiplasma divulgatum TaxID=1673428 RepID=A0A1N5W4R0_9ARCH|nr:alpha-hydroxy-acid oxidizing protein [Cuniculiplasma divulgatum]WMT49772.1 MAG: alpha-hydroxy-acid oxidizing protein [Thermoplasmatales archaeon]SIM80224.1 L-lactate 2-monooxygenase [Cuniculiplasma divulgatum]
MTDEGTKYQTKIFTGVENRKLPQSVDEWMERARSTLTKDAWDYLEGGAGDEDTVHENRSAFKKWRIRPRYLKDVSKRTMEAEFLGQNRESPFILAPIGVQSILHKDGEIASARAAAKMNMPFILSTVSSITMEEIVKKSPEGEKWLQLYPSKDKNIIRSFIKRAEKAGYRAIVVTADTTMLGWRERDLNNAYLPFLRGEGLANFFSDPEFRKRLEKPPEEDLISAIMEFTSVYVNPSFSWKDFKEICSTTEIPVVLKGITHREDVELAFKSGARAVVISNHGGRQVDGAISSLDALEEVTESGDLKGEILFDSGFRHAADAIKAIALGASGILIGRPYAYALSVAGREGIELYLEQVMAEMDLEMGLSGIKNLKELNRESLYRKYYK